MVKQVIIVVLASLATTVVLWLFGLIGRVEVGVPAGAVVSFNSSECPKTGWREYTPAYGRFVRGIDKGTDRTDPSGQRTPGSLQADQFASHGHTRPSSVFDGGDGRNGAVGGSGYGYTHKSPPGTGKSGGDETRPKNVALLYCEKLP